MADVTVKTLEEFDTAFGGAMKLARHGLGASRSGCRLLDFPPNADQYPEHDHAEDRRRRSMSWWTELAHAAGGGEDYELRRAPSRASAPAEKRKLVTGAEGARV